MTTPKNLHVQLKTGIFLLELANGYSRHPEVTPMDPNVFNSCVEHIDEAVFAPVPHDPDELPFAPEWKNAFAGLIDVLNYLALFERNPGTTDMKEVALEFLRKKKSMIHAISRVYHHQPLFHVKKNN